MNSIRLPLLATIASGLLVYLIFSEGNPVLNVEGFILPWHFIPELVATFFIGIIIKFSVPKSQFSDVLILYVFAAIITPLLVFLTFVVAGSSLMFFFSVCLIPLPMVFGWIIARRLS